ncbi:MAG: 16S rRNA processing protein RimM [Salinarimonadaceae bacterium]|nr:MAG: 16S rRNA processing protein RimM [Salinarimonadaceae bacterium]
MRQNDRNGERSRGRKAASERPAGKSAAARLPEDAVLIGEFGRAHGLRGEVRLKSFTQDPFSIAGYEPLFDDRGTPLAIVDLRSAPGGAPDLLIARLRGVATRDEVEALNRRAIYTTREAVRAAADDENDGEDDFFLADLIGLRVETPSGEARGTVVAAPDYGAGTLIEITPAHGGPSVLLPFLKSFFPVVDIAGRRLVVEADEAVFAPEPTRAALPGGEEA